MYTVQYCTLTIYRYETRDERYCYVLLHFMLFITVCDNAVSIFHHLSFVFILVWKINKKPIQFCQRHYHANSELTYFHFCRQIAGNDTVSAG